MSEAHRDQALDAAIRARSSGKIELALSLLEEILTTATDSRTRGIANGELGTIYRLYRRDLGLAQKHLQVAVELLPRSELYSLALFHTLINQSRWTEGLREMLRFVRIRQSSGYRELLSEGFTEAEFSEEEHQALVREIRSHMPTRSKER